MMVNGRRTSNNLTGLLGLARQCIFLVKPQFFQLLFMHKLTNKKVQKDTQNTEKKHLVWQTLWFTVHNAGLQLWKIPHLFEELCNLPIPLYRTCALILTHFGTKQKFASLFFSGKWHTSHSTK